MAVLSSTPPRLFLVFQRSFFLKAIVMPDSIAQRVISVISATQEIPADCISLESTRFSLGIDSLDALNVIFNLEKEFEMRIRNEGLMYAGNIGQIAEMIEQKLAGAMNGLEAER